MAHQRTMLQHARNVSGFHRNASAKSKLEQAWKQRVLPQNGHGTPVSLFKPHSGSGRSHSTERRATASRPRSPVNTQAGETAGVTFLARGMTGGAFIVILCGGRVARKIGRSSTQAGYRCY